MTAWKDCVALTIRRCRMAASLNLDTVFNPDGAEALALVLERMASLLDREISLQSASEMAAAVLEGRA